MNYSEVKRELKQEFDGFFKPKGYKSKSESQGCQFNLNNDYCEIIIGYGVRNYINEFKTGCYIRIGIKKIQRIENAIFEEYLLYDTLSTGMPEYFNVVNYNFHIKTKEDIQEWMKIVMRFYFEYAVPFIEKYNSVDAIDKLLNNDPSKRIKYSDDLAWRIIKGLIAAKLNGNPRYRELRDYYNNEVETKFQGYFMYPKCKKVIDFLDNHSQEELIVLS